MPLRCEGPGTMDACSELSCLRLAVAPPIVSFDDAADSLPAPSSAVDLHAVRLAAHSAAVPSVAHAPAAAFGFEVGGGVGGGVGSAPASARWWSASGRRGPAGGALSRDDAEALDDARRLGEPGLEWSPRTLGSVLSSERGAECACFETLQHWKPANPSSASSSIVSGCCPKAARRAAASSGMLVPTVCLCGRHPGCRFECR